MTRDNGFLVLLAFSAINEAIGTRRSTFKLLASTGRPSKGKGSKQYSALSNDEKRWCFLDLNNSFQFPASKGYEQQGLIRQQDFLKSARVRWRRFCALVPSNQVAETTSRTTESVVSTQCSLSFSLSHPPKATKQFFVCQRIFGLEEQDRSIQIKAALIPKARFNNASIESNESAFPFAFSCS